MYNYTSECEFQVLAAVQGMVAGGGAQLSRLDVKRELGLQLFSSLWQVVETVRGFWIPQRERFG